MGGDQDRGKPEKGGGATKIEHVVHVYVHGNFGGGADSGVSAKLDQIITDLAALKATEAQQTQEIASMATIMERLDTTTQKADAAIARVEEDVAALRAEIEALKQAAINRPLNAEEEAKLAALEAKLDALDPTKPDVLPEEPPA